LDKGSIWLLDKQYQWFLRYQVSATIRSDETSEEGLRAYPRASLINSGGINFEGLPGAKDDWLERKASR
jgi:hypothetical protein